MQNITPIISSVVIGIAVVASTAFATLTYSQLKTQEINNEARYQCAQSSRYQVTTDESTVWYPVEELYVKCLEEKAIQ